MKGNCSPIYRIRAKPPHRGASAPIPHPDGTHTSTDAKADVAPRGWGVLATHTNSLANSPYP